MNCVNLFCLFFMFFCAKGINSKAMFSSQFTFPLLTHHLVQNCDLRRTVFNNVHENECRNEFKVGIIGAGLSGLYAALLLQDLGIDYEILEASNRIGGRIYTHYFGKAPLDYNYVEMGAMRFPKVRQYDRFIGNQSWSLISYLNSRWDEKERLKLIPFETRHENNVFYFNGIRRFRSEVVRNGDLFGFAKSEGGVIDDKFAANNAIFWEEKAFEFLRQKINCSFDDGLEYLLRNDYKTFRGFLMDPSNEELAFPSDVVDWIEAFTAGTGRTSASLMDVYFGDAITFSDFVTVNGGSSMVIDLIHSLLKKKPKLYHKVTAIKQSKSSDILVETRNGRFSYDNVIVTPNFRLLRDIDFQCDLHLKKRSAMRTLGHEMAVKVGFEFKSRFWENSSVMNGKPIFGGISVTDLQVRHILYPSYGFNCSHCRGTLLVSYVWTRDAEKFLSKSEKEIVQLSLDNLAIIHGSVVYSQFTGNYAVMDWTVYPYSQGAFSSFDPGNFMSYYPYLIHPDANGRLHFAGDTLSLYHGWSIGALTSAYRAVKDILSVNEMESELEELESRWGTIDEPDFSSFLT